MQKQRIKILTDQVANKIAAGEVVERPASVQKELVENSIDAGATRIEIETSMGGKKFLSVSDNGIGMSKDDALICLERHATSKIRDVEDIEKIGSLGFRGEALAAIASVSRFALTTRTEQAPDGIEINVAAGKILDLRETGAPPGTTIKVRNLFYNIPARKKFLKAEQTEMMHIRKSFQNYALAWFNIAWILNADGRTLRNLPPANNFHDRLIDLYKEDFVQSLKPVQTSHGALKIQGYVALPQVTRRDRNEQYIFINKRPAFAPVLSRAISEAYHGLIPRDHHPVLFLFLSMERGSVDVNVHPTKKEVRFRNPSGIRDSVIAGIRQALSNTPPQTIETTSSSLSLPPASLPQAKVFQYPSIPLISHEVIENLDKKLPKNEHRESKHKTQAPWAWCKVLGQTQGQYVLLETDEGIVIMNPRAAHERILFERYMKEIESAKVQSQRLLQPETVELAPHEADQAKKLLSTLTDMGWEISNFGETTVLVEALPSFMGETSAKNLLPNVLHTLEEAGIKAGTEKLSALEIARATSSLAINKQQKISEIEIEQLVKDLAQTQMPYTCPNGRPTLVFMGYNELNRKFGL